MTRPWRRILLGLWMTALFWPFTHAGGYGHPALLALTPLLLSAAEWWPHWLWRWLSWAATFYVELSLAWSQWASPHLLGQVFGGALRQLFFLPFREWNQMNAHLAAPLLLVGGWLGWLVFRKCRRYGQALGLFMLGVLVIPINHVLWKLPGELALAGYLVVGLFVLTDIHRQSIENGALRVRSPRATYVIWGVAALLPLIVGWEVPAHRPADPLGIFKGQVLPGIGSSGTTATIGYGPGVTHIGRSLVASKAPVLLVKASHPAYWQAAIYSSFNGQSWSNPGSNPTYPERPSDRAVPLITPYFPQHTPVKTFRATVTDLAPGSLTSLFYTGVPTHFSVSATVHTAASQFIPQKVRKYRVSMEIPLENLSSIASTGFSQAPASLSADLEIPANLSPKVGQIAANVTQQAEGPWQAAQAVKQYLDSHYRYSLTVSPTKRDVVNHFLFVDKKGYCDQFSTAFIMMMRALGIPARWVVGYSSGKYSSARHGYVVRAIDAHSWAQIWIAGSGWVPFDPTPGFSAPLATRTPSGTGARGGSVGASTAPNSPQPSVQPISKPHQLVRPGLLGPTGRNSTSSGGQRRVHVWEVLVALALAGIGIGASRRLTRREKSPAERLWTGIQALSSRRLGIRWQQKSPRQWGQDWVRFFPNDADVIWPMVALLECAFYRNDALTEDEQQKLWSLWRALRQRAKRSA